MKIEAFRVDVSDDALTDLQDRLARTRWPGDFANEQWARDASAPSKGEVPVKGRPAKPTVGSTKAPARRAAGLEADAGVGAERLNGG